MRERGAQYKKSSLPERPTLWGNSTTTALHRLLPVPSLPAVPLSSDRGKCLFAEMSSLMLTLFDTKMQCVLWEMDFVFEARDQVRRKTALPAGGQTDCIIVHP